MKAKVKNKIKGFRTVDGAGVHLVRVLGHQTIKEFDPILMLDSFDSHHPDDYTAGFPMHPHRGIETISYVSQGQMMHKDSLGNTDTISDGEVQWMCAGSGILHEEGVPAVPHLLGVQLWLNLPAKEKMAKPTYHSIKRDDILEIPIEGGLLRLLAGNYLHHKGFCGNHLPLDYYDIQLQPNASFTIAINENESVMLFTLQHDVHINGEHIEEKTAVKMGNGEIVTITSTSESAQVLFIRSIALQEPVIWGGPIVMNTKEELQDAFDALHDGSFLTDEIAYTLGEGEI